MAIKKYFFLLTVPTYAIFLLIAWSSVGSQEAFRSFCGFLVCFPAALITWIAFNSLKHKGFLWQYGLFLGGIFFRSACALGFIFWTKTNIELLGESQRSYLIWTSVAYLVVLVFEVIDMFLNNPHQLNMNLKNVKQSASIQHALESNTVTIPE